MRPRPTKETLADRRHAARLGEIQAIERAARTAIMIHQAQARADARGAPLADFWVKQAEALATAWL